jgi:hypothetical protein
MIFIHSVVCLTRGPQRLPTRVPHRVRSSVSPFNFRYPLFSYGHPVAAYSSLSSFPHAYPTLYLSFNNVFEKAVPTQDMTNVFSRISFCCIQNVPLLLDFK